MSGNAPQRVKLVAGFRAIFPNGCTRDLVEAQGGPNWAMAKG